MPNPESNGWEEVEEAAEHMFEMWLFGSEHEFAKEAWGHLFAAGLVSFKSLIESTASKLRLLTLAVAYREFGRVAWEEDRGDSLNDLVEGLDVDPVALGILASRTGANDFSRIIEGDDLFEIALRVVTKNERKTVFECLKRAYGDEIKLYSRMWHTKCSECDEDCEGDEFEVTGPNSVSLRFIECGFVEGG